MKTNLIRRILNSRDLIFLGIFSFLSKFFLLNQPPKVVFDEAHFGLYATKYLSHQWYFDIHPPLGKLLIAFFGFLGKINPGFDFAVGSNYEDLNFLALRFLPAFLGSLLVILIYLFVREIGFSKRVAFLAGFLVLFDNAILVQSRFILLDVILLFFIFLSLYLFVLIKRYHLFSKKWYFFSFLCAFSLGAAISIKLTGFGILAIVWFLTVFEEHLFSKRKKEILVKIILLFLAPLIFYFLIFAIHFSLTPSPCTEDCGVVLDRYLGKEGLEHLNSPLPGNLLVRFYNTNKLMIGHNLDPRISFYYQSDWWSWPLMLRPIQYFKEEQNSKTSFIYFFGNPIVWWLGIVGILGYLYLIVRNYFYRFKLKIPSTFYSKSFTLLILGYLFYMIPFATIPRFMLIYHYLPALIFSIIIFSVFFEGVIKMLFNYSLDDQILFNNKKANILFFGLLIIIFLSFVYFSPLTYGFPLTDEAFQGRMWLDTWHF